jgi:hypothetical protein
MCVLKHFLERLIPSVLAHVIMPKTSVQEDPGLHLSWDICGVSHPFMLFNNRCVCCYVVSDTDIVIRNHN